MGLLWFGCLDSYLRCISVENLFLKLSNSESLDADDLGLELKGQLNPISCLCLGPENYEPITGFFNGDIKV